MSQAEEYKLTETEKRYLRTGETGSYSEPRLQNRIQEKQNNIGSRISTLIKDISLMYDSELYDFDNNKCDIFKDIEISPMTKALDIHLSREVSTNRKLDQYEPVSTPRSGEEFGFLIGGFIYILFTMISNNKPWKKTLRGLCHFYINRTGEKASNRLRDLEEIIDFEPHESLKYAIYTGIDNSNRYFCREEPDGLPIIPVLNRVETILEKKNIPTTGFLSKHLFLEEYYQEESHRSLEKQINDNLSNVKKRGDFVQVIELYKTIISDEENLGKNWRGPDRLDIIKQMCCGRSKIKSSTIAANLGESPSTHLVTNGLRRMSAEVDETQRWTSYPVTEEYSDGWKLTSYGRLLAMYISGELTGSEIERYSVPNQDCVNEENKNIISEALEQISEN